MKAPKPSLYLAIGENIKRQIAAGALKEGDRLPSCRDCAAELGVNPNTVQRAYTRLEDEGVVFTIAKKGVFISSARRPRPDRNQTLAAKIAELKNLGYEQSEVSAAVRAVYGGEHADGGAD